MKNLIPALVFGFLVSTVAHADVYEECVATKILDQSVFEESFSILENSNVTISREGNALTVQIGTNLFKPSRRIETGGLIIAQIVGNFGYFIKDHVSKDTIEIFGGLKRVGPEFKKFGKIVLQKRNVPEKVIAEIECKN